MQPSGVLNLNQDALTPKECEVSASVTTVEYPVKTIGT